MRSLPFALSRARGALAAYPELSAVLIAAVVGLCARGPAGWAAAHHGIDALLAVLVFATALTIDPAAPRRLAAVWRRAALAVVAGLTVLPALSWAVSFLVPAGPLRDGVLVTGLAPSEIASVAVTALAGGEAAVAAGVLIGSTLATVLLAGPILALLAGGADFSVAAVIENLALVVAVPLAAGTALRAQAESAMRAQDGKALRAQAESALRAQASTPPRAKAGTPPRAQAGTPLRKRAGTALCAQAPPALHAGSRAVAVLASPRAQRVATAVALAAVAALVALVASEVRFSAGYAAVAGALLLFLAGSVLLGRLLAARSSRPVAAALLLTTAMRDFAVAAAIAAAAFGPQSAAPLGLYGIAVLIGGTAGAGFLRNAAGRTAALATAVSLPG